MPGSSPPCWSFHFSHLPFSLSSPPLHAFPSRDQFLCSSPVQGGKLVTKQVKWPWHWAAKSITRLQGFSPFPEAPPSPFCCSKASPYSDRGRSRGFQRNSFSLSSTCTPCFLSPEMKEFLSRTGVHWALCVCHWHVGWKTGLAYLILFPPVSTAST